MYLRGKRKVSKMNKKQPNIGINIKENIPEMKEIYRYIFFFYVQYSTITRYFCSCEKFPS